MLNILCFGHQNGEIFQRLSGRFPEANWLSSDRPHAEELAQSDAIIGFGPQFSPSLFEHTRQLKWIQSMTTGVDAIFGCANLPDGVTVTSTRGIHGPQMSELAFLLMLSLIRNFPRMQKNQQSHTWAVWPQPLLYGKTATIVGLGAIAEALIPRLKAFGMTVQAVTGSPRDLPGLDRCYGRERIVEAAATCDFLIIIVPYAPETHHLVDANVLGAMKPSAFLVNVARGGVLDETALIETLKARRIAGAGLDVFTVEPLPADSPLWDLDNVIITPKIGGMSDIYLDQALPIVEANVAEFLAGRIERLTNVVTRA